MERIHDVVSLDLILGSKVNSLAPSWSSDDDDVVRIVCPDHLYDFLCIRLDVTFPCHLVTIRLVTDFPKDIRIWTVFLWHFIKKFLWLFKMNHRITISKNMPVNDDIDTKFDRCFYRINYLSLDGLWIKISAFSKIHCTAPDLAVPVITEPSDDIFVGVFSIPLKSMRAHSSKLNRFSFRIAQISSDYLKLAITLNNSFSVLYSLPCVILIFRWTWYKNRRCCND